MRKKLFYKLEGNEAIPVENMEDWLVSFKGRDRKVKSTTIGEVYVSTVFLGLDHSHTEKGLPILFETMIFGGKHDGYQKRYETWAQAEAGHEQAVEKVNGTD